MDQGELFRGAAAHRLSHVQPHQRRNELERTADSRELAGLRRARSVELDTLQRTTYQTTGSYRTNIRDVPDAYTNAPVISIDARGSTMSEGQIRGLVVQALAANNQERDRTHFERVEAIRRMGG